MAAQSQPATPPTAERCKSIKRRLRAPSPALVISLIALFVALGGTSYAAIHLPKNSVAAKQLKKNSVTGTKIKNRAVTKAKINTSGLTVPNATNAANAAVAASLSGAKYVVSASVSNPATSQNTGTGTVTCPAGTFVVGGGAFGSSGGQQQAINTSIPIESGGSPAPNAWRVDMNNASASAFTFNVYAICVPLTNPTPAP